MKFWPLCNGGRARRNSCPTIEKTKPPVGIPGRSGRLRPTERRTIRRRTAIVAVGGYLALHKTRWGRFVYAIGGNPEAARLAGVNVKRVLVSVYVLIGCLAGLAGFILSARLGSAEAVAGISFELRVIASVVIGGTSLMGGYGRIGGTIIGSIIMGILINGLVLMNVSAYYQQIITGLIIVLAVAFDTYAKSRRGAL
mgnify:CR=1 FL=1